MTVVNAQPDPHPFDFLDDVLDVVEFSRAVHRSEVAAPRNTSCLCFDPRELLAVEPQLQRSHINKRTNERSAGGPLTCTTPREQTTAKTRRDEGV